MSHDKTGTGIINLSRARGFPAKLFYMMQSTPTDGVDAVFTSLQSHLQYWIDLENRGVVLAGGPLLPEDLGRDYEGMGVIVFRAGSFREAEEICARDPMHESGARRFTVTPWLINHENSSP